VAALMNGYLRRIGFCVEDSAAYTVAICQDGFVKRVKIELADYQVPTQRRAALNIAYCAASKNLRQISGV
jgi:hypothetical protein